MDENDGVRTRLTHSHEVANLARSIGSNVAMKTPGLFDVDLYSTVQPILAAIGLAHDLGNPPFGHQGEAAMGNWFESRRDWIFSHQTPALGGYELDITIEKDLQDEFFKFDGNPQTFRLITQLQTHRDFMGLDLTAATLAASLKYPVGSGSTVSGHAVFKKFGYFEAEREVLEWMRAETGISEKQRHPLTWVMEACDDIAYSILDVDDVMKKKIISPDDVLAILLHDKRSKDHPAVTKTASKFKGVHDLDRDPRVARDIKISLIRSYLISALIEEASESFTKASASIMAMDHEVPLLEGNPLCGALQEIARLHAFTNPAVLKMETLGAEALDGLMTFFWTGISTRKDFDNIESKRTTAPAKFSWSLISPNYIEAAKRGGDTAGPSSGMRYRELRLLTDMVSGMTDTFALNLWNEVKLLPK